MRNFLRHPTDIPIEIVPGDKSRVQGKQKLTNLSHGGIAFQSATALVEGDHVQININCVEPRFSAQGIVKWCRPNGDKFDLGIEFAHPDDEFKARMVEQVCHIEQYKKEVLIKQGRELTGQQAAMEWIELYAAVFPGNDTNE